MQRNSSKAIEWYKSDITGFDINGSHWTVLELENGEFAVFGSTGLNWPSHNWVFYKYDLNGNQLDSENYPNGIIDYGRSMIETYEGEIVLTGNIEVSQSSDNLKVSKINYESLQEEWSYLYDQNTSKGLDLTQSYDGGYIIAGFKYEDNDYNKQRALLIRLGSDETPIDEPVEYRSIMVCIHQRFGR